jgi:hypothetical protein
MSILLHTLLGVLLLCAPPTLLRLRGSLVVMGHCWKVGGLLVLCLVRVVPCAALFFPSYPILGLHFVFFFFLFIFLLCCLALRFPSYPIFGLRFAFFFFLFIYYVPACCLASLSSVDSLICFSLACFLMKNRVRLSDQLRLGQLVLPFHAPSRGASFSTVDSLICAPLSCFFMKNRVRHSDQ